MGQVSDSVITLVEQHLDDLALRTHRRVGDVVGVAVTMAATDGRPVTVGASTELARRVDRVQYELGIGPCLAAMAGQGAFYVPDLGADPRWGPYGPAAVDLGVRCCVSLPVGSGDEVTAVVKAYAAATDGLTEGQRAVTAELAGEVGGSIGLARALTSQARELDDRTAAMDHRRVIDLAIGVAMERARCTPQAAFEMLRRQSQHENVRLFEVAQALVAGFGGEVTRAPFSLRTEPRPSV